MATWGISGPVDLLRRTGILWWRCWPRLVAIYLVGWLTRYGALKLAIFVSVHVGGLWGDLVFPLVPLARLLTYVAMFWVVRGAVTNARASWTEATNTVLRSILPVFVLFTAWKLHLEDRAGYLNVRYLEYYGSTMDGLSSAKTSEQINQYLSPTDWRIYAVIGIAFAIRMLLTRFREKLPTWTQLLALYLEATWVLLLVTAAADKLFGTPEWIKERRVVVWYLNEKEEPARESRPSQTPLGVGNAIHRGGDTRGPHTFDMDCHCGSDLRDSGDGYLVDEWTCIPRRETRDPSRQRRSVGDGASPAAVVARSVGNSGTNYRIRTRLSGDIGEAGGLYSGDLARWSADSGDLCVRVHVPGVSLPARFLLRTAGRGGFRLARSGQSSWPA
jgi:hypothetical protein